MTGGQVPFVGTLPRISQWLTAGQNTIDPDLPGTAD